MPTRVVVYAEGAGELYGAFTLAEAPGTPLSDVELGAAQILVRRTIQASEAGRVVQFEEPLVLTSSLRPPRGSDLQVRKDLRRLLTWPAHRRPDLAVVLIDEDGDEARLPTVKSYLEADWTPPVAIGVAVREFESWLIGDMQAVRDVLSISIDESSDPEGMEPRQAKDVLTSWLQRSHAVEEARVVRGHIAGKLRLDALSRSSRSFRRFREELGAALSLIARR